MRRGGRQEMRRGGRQEMRRRGRQEMRLYPAEYRQTGRHPDARHGRVDGRHAAPPLHANRRTGVQAQTGGRNASRRTNRQYNLPHQQPTPCLSRPICPSDIALEYYF